MAKKPRRNHGAAFKARVALEAIRGDEALVELSERLVVITKYACRHHPRNFGAEAASR